MKKIILAMALFLGSLGAANAQTTIKNGGLENWRTSKLLFNLTATLETPQGWSSFDSVFNIINFISGQNTQVTNLVKKSTTVKNSGLTSAQLTTKSFSDLGLMPGYLTNAKLSVDANINFNFSGGEVLASKPIVASAMVNYKPATVYDSANLYVEVINTTLGVDSVLLRYYFVSSYSDDTTESHLLNSSLYVDDVTYTTVKSETYALMSELNVACYPNPTTDVITVTATKGNSLVCEIHSATGQLMLVKPFDGSMTVKVSDWSAGVYTYNVKDQSNVIVGHGQLAVVRP